ncbi:hypothetical protein HK097_005740 [Rhizophlyctis rosea]|uniref:TPR-like protein n=1 Tax=Rhizophlyctis rosea TaxID=64517 RepID=A0AAD5S174_9FUNG|nr:hypothetical protein HK097_005740 [Rhizophlyctis rosea]
MATRKLFQTASTTCRTLCKAPALRHSRSPFPRSLTSSAIHINRRTFASTLPTHASHADNLSTTDPLIQKAQEWFDKGTEKWNEEDYQGALDAYEKSIWSRPTADAHYNVANCYLALGNYEKAIKSWQESLALSPSRSDAHINIANVTALKLRDLPTAITHYEAALSIDPTDGEARYNFGVVLDSMGRLEEAIEQYEKAVQSGVEVAEKNLRNAKAKLKEREVGGGKA